LMTAMSKNRKAVNLMRDQFKFIRRRLSQQNVLAKSNVLIIKNARSLVIVFIHAE
jgi:hypothetical protein